MMAVRGRALWNSLFYCFPNSFLLFFPFFLSKFYAYLYAINPLDCDGPELLFFVRGWNLFFSLFVQKISPGMFFLSFFIFYVYVQPFGL